MILPRYRPGAKTSTLAGTALLVAFGFVMVLFVIPSGPNRPIAQKPSAEKVEPHDPPDVTNDRPLEAYARLAFHALQCKSLTDTPEADGFREVLASFGERDVEALHFHFRVYEKQGYSQFSKLYDLSTTRLSDVSYLKAQNHMQLVVNYSASDGAVRLEWARWNFKFLATWKPEPKVVFVESGRR